MRALEMAWSSQGEKAHECDKRTRLCYHLHKASLVTKAEELTLTPNILCLM